MSPFRMYCLTPPKVATYKSYVKIVNLILSERHCIFRPSAASRLAWAVVGQYKLLASDIIRSHNSK